MKRKAKAEALKTIKMTLTSGKVILTRHFKERLIDRNITIQEAVQAIKNGNIYNEAEPHPKTGNWIYNVEGKTIDGKALRIAVDILENGIVLLTVIG